MVGFSTDIEKWDRFELGKPLERLNEFIEFVLHDALSANWGFNINMEMAQVH